jgi:gluconate 2-dehydrogenase gamma chain
MSAFQPQRREFLAGAVSAAGAAWLAAHWPAIVAAADEAASARAAGATPVNLDAATARGLDAIATLIIPTDDTPGAREAGVVSFIDAALGTFAAPQAALLRDGVAALDAAARTSYPDAADFAALPADAQTALLTREQASPFFDAVRFLTVCGTFASPAYGGNRDAVGWKLIGFDHRHAWSPPFGFYDAQAAKDGA